MAKRILVADDSVTIQKVVELSFKEEDYEVRVVSDGQQALHVFGAEPADLVIADVHMPGADGYQVASAIKQGAPGVPVILLVGTFEPQDDEKAKVADAVLNKPFDSQELLGLARRLLAASETAATEAPGGPAEAPEAAAAAPRPAAPEAAPAAAAAAGEPAAAGGELSAETIEAIARRVATLIGPELVREVAWEVVPDLAEVAIRDRLRELERQVE